MPEQKDSQYSSKSISAPPTEHKLGSVKEINQRQELETRTAL